MAQIRSDVMIEDAACPILRVTFRATARDRAAANEGPLRRHLALLRQVQTEASHRAILAGLRTSPVARVGDWHCTLQLAPGDVEHLRAAIELLVRAADPSLLRSWLRDPPAVQRAGDVAWSPML